MKSKPKHEADKRDDLFDVKIIKFAAKTAGKRHGLVKCKTFFSSGS